MPYMGIDETKSWGELFSTYRAHVGHGYPERHAPEAFIGVLRVRLSRSERAILERILSGWIPLKAQLPNGMAMERRGLLRLDWGPEGSPDAERMCWYPTSVASEEMKGEIT
jgi:hypothetical protein